MNYLALILFQYYWAPWLPKTPLIPLWSHDSIKGKRTPEKVLA